MIKLIKSIELMFYKIIISKYRAKFILIVPFLFEVKLPKIHGIIA